MSKAKFLFRCKNCSALFNKWQGKCEQCSSWDTIEKLDEKLSQNTATSISKADRLTAIADTEEKDIWQTGVYELDRVLGKGFVYQSIGLLGGAPGIGKSTLILQILGRLTKLQKKVLYVSGEESASQIKLRAQRLEVSQENIFIIIENSLENILATVTQLKPDFILIDSIQTVSTEEYLEVKPKLEKHYENFALLQTKPRYFFACRTYYYSLPRRIQTYRSFQRGRVRMLAH